MLDKARMPVRATRRFYIRQITEPAQEPITELIRLLVLYPHSQNTLHSLGIGREDMAAHLGATLPRPGGILLAADDGRRLKGLLYLEPVLDQSALLNLRVWNLRLLIVAPDAPPDVVDALLNYAIGSTGTAVDFIYASIPAADGQGIAGLQRQGFRVVSGEAVAVMADPKPSMARSDTIRVAPLDAATLEEAIQVACRCKHCNAYLHDPLFDAGLVYDQARNRQTRAMAGGDGRALVALGDDGGVLGVTTFSLDAALPGETRDRIATIDTLCIDSNGQHKVVERLLGRKAIGELALRGANRVLTRILMNGSPSCARVESMKKLGFEVTQSNLLMHRWMNQPARGIAENRASQVPVRSATA